MIPSPTISLPAVNIPTIPLEELRWRAVSFFNDRGTFWKKFGCPLFAQYNQYSSFELSEFEAPDWSPISSQADPELIRQVCILYLHHKATCAGGDMYRANKAMGKELGRKYIDGLFYLEVKAKYPVLMAGVLK